MDIATPTKRGAQGGTDSMDQSFKPIKQRIVFVSGGMGGIGTAVCRRLARTGARVVAGCLPGYEKKDAWLAQMQAEGLQVHAAEGNVDDYASCAEMFYQIGSVIGPVDILVNNAGITRDQLLMRMSEEDFDRVLEVNLKGAWNFLKAASRPLMKSKGRVINITSVVGLSGNAGQSNYAASKAGLIGLTKSIAKELAGRGVCVNAVAPGFISTDMTAALDEASRTKLLQSIPLGRLGGPEEIAAAVEYLAGPGGAYITGQTLVVDGGAHMH